MTFRRAPAAIVAVARDDCGTVLLASPDGQRYRAVDRLAMSAAEGGSLFSGSSPTPILSADDVRRLYGTHIAKLKLARG